MWGDVLLLDSSTDRREHTNALNGVSGAILIMRILLLDYSLKALRATAHSAGRRTHHTACWWKLHRVFGQSRDVVRALLQATHGMRVLLRVGVVVHRHRVTVHLCGDARKVAPHLACVTSATHYTANEQEPFGGLGAKEPPMRSCPLKARNRNTSHPAARSLFRARPRVSPDAPHRKHNRGALRQYSWCRRGVAKCHPPSSLWCVKTTTSTISGGRTTPRPRARRTCRTRLKPTINTKARRSPKP